MLTNYHTHCNLCKHAGGTIEEYVLEAVDKGFDILGMSDHLPYKDVDYGYRMEYKEKDIYFDEITRLKEKYKKDIKLYSGMECEYLPQYNNYYEELLKDSRCDYLLLGAHFFMDNSGELQYTSGITDTSKYIEYAKKTVDAMRTGYFKYLCHPDLIGVGNFKINDDFFRAFDIIIDGAIKYDFILEYNANGIRRGITELAGVSRYQYPIEEFWNMTKASGVKVIVGSDCHIPKVLCDDKFQESIKYLDNNRFNRIIELDIK